MANEKKKTLRELFHDTLKEFISLKGRSLARFQKWRKRRKLMI